MYLMCATTDLGFAPLVKLQDRKREQLEQEQRRPREQLL